MFYRTWGILAICLTLLVGAAWSQDSKLATEINDMRGDQGLLEDFGPRGIAWMNDGKLFVVDRRYNVFHIFDTQGRRFRLLDVPVPDMPAPFYNALARLDDKVMFAAGSHYHIKNNTRFLSARSVISKIEMVNEGAFTNDTCVDNYSPDTAFRATGYYGDSPKQRLELSGLAMDKRHNRVFAGCNQPLDPDGTVMLYTGPLDKFLKRDKDFRWEMVKTGIKPGTNSSLGVQYYCSDIEYVPDKGLVLLLTSSKGEEDQLQLGNSQLWFLKGGFGPGKLLYQDLLPGNRATGLTIKPQDKWTYTAAIVCDNAMEDTKIPSRLAIVKGIVLPLK